MGDSAEVEYRNSLKVRYEFAGLRVNKCKKLDVQLKYEQLRKLKICAKYSSAVFHQNRVDESSDNLYPEV